MCIRNELQPTYAVRDCCRVLVVSTSGYYRWKNATPSARSLRRSSLTTEVCGEHERSRGVYGSPRIHAQLCKRQIHVNVKTVAHIMNDANIRAKTVKKWHPRTTQSNHTIAPAANVIERNFAASGPNEKWLCDITYIATDEGFLYLAGVMDVWSRSIVGWSMANTLHATIVTDALTMAVKRRSPPIGLVHHSDRGVQYACRACRDILEQHGMQQSMSRAGDCYDNAMMESLWATLKKELVQHAKFKTRAQARSSIFEWIEVWYQRERSHSSLGYLSPEQFEAARRVG